MYKTFTILVCVCLLAGCQTKKMDPKQLTNVTVMRNTEGQNTSTLKNNIPEENARANQNIAPKNQRLADRKSQYYIIVASYPLADRPKAEKLTNGLKDKGYPAEIIEAKGRLRVSIERFSTLEEAQIQRDKYREITDRQDIWILYPGNSGQ